MAKTPGKSEQIKKLMEQFRMLGAPDPKSWAESQIEEEIPQYARFVFLRQAWSTVVDEADTSWIDSRIESASEDPQEPGAGIGPALSRALAAGATREDLTEIVRVMQWELLQDLMYQLSDPGVVDYPNEDLPQVNWMLFEVDDDNNPLHSIEGLHESVLETDPTGREMRPNSTP